MKKYIVYLSCKKKRKEFTVKNIGVIKFLKYINLK